MEIVQWFGLLAVGGVVMTAVLWALLSFVQTTLRATQADEATPAYRSHPATGDAIDR